MNRCYLLPHLALVIFALLRIGEIASDNKSQSGDHVMLISDISFHKNKGDEELYVTIRSSKTNQRSLSSNMIICKQGDETVCPVRLLTKYLQIRTFSTSCLYAHVDGTGLTRYQFSSVLQKTLSFCEIRDHFRSHSFKIGGATEATRLGVDDETIKKWGHRTSDAYLKYLRLDM